MVDSLNNNLPKFLIGDRHENDDEWLIHLHYPRFAMEIDEDCTLPEGNHNVCKQFIWLDGKPEEPESKLAELMRQADEFIDLYYARVEQDNAATFQIENGCEAFEFRVKDTHPDGKFAACKFVNLVKDEQSLYDGAGRVSIAVENGLIVDVIYYGRVEADDIDLSELFLDDELEPEITEGQWQAVLQWEANKRDEGCYIYRGIFSSYQFCFA
ncbi:MAG: hypothetical protein MI892_12050 [Desulfobacterales bacterium]|nr:hypothetical protein [Desulfobacterales bacterium]